MTTRYTYAEMKRKSVKNGIVPCPKCGKMAKKHGLLPDGHSRMYEHGGEIVGGFAVIKDKCIVDEAAQ